MSFCHLSTNDLIMLVKGLLDRPYFISLEMQQCTSFTLSLNMVLLMIKTSVIYFNFSGNRYFNWRNWHTIYWDKEPFTSTTNARPLALDDGGTGQFVYEHCDLLYDRGKPIPNSMEELTKYFNDQPRKCLITTQKNHPMLKLISVKPKQKFKTFFYIQKRN